MDENSYRNLGGNKSIGDIIGDYLVQIEGLLDDAENQAHNDCGLGVAISVGSAKAIMKQLKEAWKAVEVVE